MMKRIATLFVVSAGLIAGSYATDSRVEVMGRSSHPWFYRDEVTIFRNPADMSLYGNMLYGSFGNVSESVRSDEGFGTDNFIPENGFTNDPFFGAVLSIGGDDDGAGAFSIGAFANRHDPILNRLPFPRVIRMEMGPVPGCNPDDEECPESPTGEFDEFEPAGKFDLMISRNFGGFLTLGVGYYGVFNSEKVGSDINYQNTLHKVALGMNVAIDEKTDIEAAINFGLIQAQWDWFDVDADAGTGGFGRDTIDGDWFLQGDLRAFFGIDEINGALVPQASLLYYDINGISALELDAGLGLNINIDRGFFFGGLQAIYRTADRTGTADVSAINREELGARLSFGIERNIVWDWFMIRVGGQKELVRTTNKNDADEDVAVWNSNPANDGSSGDLVGLGFGVNIDNRLRIDATVSEQLPYTLTNLISGNMSNLFHRVSATFRF